MNHPARQFLMQMEAEDRQQKVDKKLAKSLSADPEFLKPGRGNHSAQKIVSLWVAVCDCTGINPNHKAARMDWVQQHASDVEGAAGEALQCLMGRYAFAEHAAQAGELKTVGPDHKVSLGAFVAFAQQAGWVLPTDFAMEKPNARETATPAPSAAQEPQDAPVEDVGASDGVELLPAHEFKRNVATGPVFSMTRAALVSTHLHHWSTIERDLKGAATNGLSAAKAGARGWDEAAALAWAKAKNKLKSAARPADALTRVMHNMGNLPATRHALKG